MREFKEKLIQLVAAGKGRTLIMAIIVSVCMTTGLTGCAAMEASKSSGQAAEEVTETGDRAESSAEETAAGTEESAGQVTDEETAEQVMSDDSTEQAKDSETVAEQAKDSETVAEQTKDSETATEQAKDSETAQAGDTLDGAASTQAPVLEEDFAAIMKAYNEGLDMEDNPFWDSLVYTGYNIEKHYSDGLMWHYVLAAHKRGKGWLSDITYAGGSSGYETTKEGLPDIGFFEDHGLVCASYVTYVYFNYLPNVAGIDTSVLTKPEKSYSANDWYIAAKDWVEQGYSETIDFEASLTNAGFIDFDTLEEMPVGSIIAFCDSRNKSDHCSHVVIYAGYENNYHWVYHVGNENGPEFCSVERMHFGPDPQWPIAVITTPDFVMEALTEETQASE